MEPVTNLYDRDKKVHSHGSATVTSHRILWMGPVRTRVAPPACALRQPAPGAPSLRGACAQLPVDGSGMCGVRRAFVCAGGARADGQIRAVH